MARIRTIKPEFFTSEDIVALSPLARLLYVASWCEADREGRLTWKPRTMKLRYFPADDCDIDALARELVASGLVVLYGDGLAYVPSFGRHQHINPREAASTLPDPDGGIDASARVTDTSLPVNDAQVGREGKGREGKEIHASHVVAKVATIDCPHDEIIALYHDLMPANPRVRAWTGTRQSNLRARWREDEKRQGLDYWRRLLTYASQSAFLTGQKSGPDGRPFLPGLDWLVKPENFAKLIEGRYHDRSAA